MRGIESLDENFKLAQAVDGDSRGDVVRADESRRRLPLAALNEVRARQHRRVNYFVRLAEHFAVDFFFVEKFFVVGRSLDNHARRNFNFRLRAEVQIKFFVTLKPRRRDENFFQDAQINIVVKFRAARQPFENPRAVSAHEHVRDFFLAIMTVIVENFDKLAEIMEEPRRRELRGLQNIFNLLDARFEF